MNRLELKAAVDTYLHRALPDEEFDLFLLQAESDIAQQVRAIEQQSYVSLGEADRQTANAYLLPADFIEMITVRRSGAVEIMPAASMEMAQFRQIEGKVSVYSLTGVNQLIDFAPTPADGFVAYLGYFAKPAALAAPTDTNTLITSHPSLYIYSCVMYAYDWARNYEQREAASNRFVAKIDEINAIDQRRRYGPSVSVGNNQDFGAWGASNGGM